MADEWSDRQERLVPDGMEKVWPMRVCQRCRTENKYMSKLHKLKVCFACKLKEDDEAKRQPHKAFRLLCAATALLLVVCVGCQSGPREVQVHAHIVGQELKVSVMR